MAYVWEIIWLETNQESIDNQPPNYLFVLNLQLNPIYVIH